MRLRLVDFLVLQRIMHYEDAFAYKFVATGQGHFIRAGIQRAHLMELFQADVEKIHESLYVLLKEGLIVDRIIHKPKIERGEEVPRQRTFYMYYTTQKGRDELTLFGWEAFAEQRKG